MAIFAESYTPSYWLLGDDQLELSKDRSREFQFLAHFKHSLLFNPSLLLSDSMAIDNANFRHLLESNVEFRELINSGTLSIALRQNDNGVTRDLLELRDEFIRKRRSRVPELDASNDGLSYLARSANIVPFSMHAVSSYFQERSVSVFENDEVRGQLSEQIAADVISLTTAARRESRSDFGLDFFLSNLPEQLRRIHPGLTESQTNEIFGFAQQPYLTALPAVIETSSVYARKHARAFRICGGRSRMVSCGETDSRTILLRTGLAGFGNGIALLSSEDILRLRETDEARFYFQARHEFDVATYEDSKRQFAIALGDYVRRIEDDIFDHVLKVPETAQLLEVTFDIKESRKEQLIRNVDYIPDLFTYITVTAAFGGAALGYDLSLPVALGLLVVRPVLNAATFGALGVTPGGAARNAETLRRHAVDTLSELWGESQRIDAELTAYRSRQRWIPSETLYTSEKTS